MYFLFDANKFIAQGGPYLTFHDAYAGRERIKRSFPGLVIVKVVDAAEETRCPQCGRNDAIVLTSDAYHCERCKTHFIPAQSA